jgi:cytochrome bd-type quinol oxidase subunit 1
MWIPIWGAGGGLWRRPPPGNCTAATNTKETLSDATIWVRIDLGTFQFAILGMAVMLTISSFLVLIKTDTCEEYPDPMWVLVYVLFVSWFPSLLGWFQP